MSKWISVEDDLPNQFQIVWIYWRDREVLLGCKTALDSDPNDCWWSFNDEKCRWTNWWMPIIDGEPLAKPLKPEGEDE